MSSAIQRVVTELTAALAEIEQAQIALANAQATTAQALMGFAQATEGSNHELTKETRAYWAGASSKFDLAGRLLEASMRAVAAYQHHIAPGLVGDYPVPSVPPSGENIVTASRDRGSRLDRLLQTALQNAGDAAEITKGAVNKGDEILAGYRQLPKPPAATHAETKPAWVPAEPPTRSDSPTPGDVASGIALGALAVVLGYQHMRRQREKRQHDDE